MTRPNKHIGQNKSGPAKTFFGLTSGHGQPTVTPPTALFGGAVLFLNHCGCAGWSVSLLFANPQDSFSHVVAHMFYEHKEMQYSSAVLRHEIQNIRIVDKHVLHFKIKTLFLISIS